MENLTDKEKATFILGMIRVFEQVGWPDHFNEDDIKGWKWNGKIAFQICTGGAFNPLDHAKLMQVANEELGLQYATD